MTEQQNSARLGQSGPFVGPIGIGTWAIGGPFYSGEGCRYPTGAPLGYGLCDDAESIRAIHAAIDHGAVLIDTADAYGTGHAERVLGQAIQGRRDRVLIATKFGNTYREETKELTGTNVATDYIRQACHASLKRLNSDWIDLYQLHLGNLPLEEAEAVAEALDRLCDEGLIRGFGWSTDDLERAALFAKWPRAHAVQFDMNVFDDPKEMVGLCEEEGLTGLVRQPLAMGFLSGKFTPQSQLPKDDIRSQPPEWLRYFNTGGGAVAAWQARLDNIRDILTSKGRSPVQGALAWIWARGDHLVSIPGIRTVAQAEENLATLSHGPLEPDQLLELDRLLQRQ